MPGGFTLEKRCSSVKKMKLLEYISLYDKVKCLGEPVVYIVAVVLYPNKNIYNLAEGDVPTLMKDVE